MVGLGEYRLYDLRHDLWQRAGVGLTKAAWKRIKALVRERAISACITDLTQEEGPAATAATEEREGGEEGPAMRAPLNTFQATAFHGGPWNANGAHALMASNGPGGGQRRRRRGTRAGRRTLSNSQMRDASETVTRTLTDLPVELLRIICVDALSTLTVGTWFADDEGCMCSPEPHCFYSNEMKCITKGSLGTRALART